MYRIGDWLGDTTLKPVHLHLARPPIEPRLGSVRRSMYAVSVLTLCVVTERGRGPLVRRRSCQAIPRSCIAHSPVPNVILLKCHEGTFSFGNE